MPDATGLELLAQKIGDEDAEAVLGTVFFRERATLLVSPHAVPAALRMLKNQGYGFLAWFTASTTSPRSRASACTTRCSTCTTSTASRSRRASHTDAPEIPSVTPEWPTANHQEREIFDLFGVIFTGHPNLKRILMPDDYEGHPQRRDFPIGGEPVLFTHNETKVPAWWK